MKWPTVEQLQALGLARCKTDACTTWLNPSFNASGHCQHHLRKERAKRSRERRFRHEVRFAPTDRRRHETSPA